MPSINTETLEKFVRTNPVTNAEWFDIIEARRKLIQPHLDTFTLPELGKLECMESESSLCHALGHDVSFSLGDKRFSLATQGIFTAQPCQAVEKFPNTGFRPFRGGINRPNGIRRVWGLTRSGLWILATIDFVGVPGYKERGREQAKVVTIEEASLSAIAGATKESPRRMWEVLGAAIKSWAARREELYHRALNLARLVEIEELSSSLISE